MLKIPLAALVAASLTVPAIADQVSRRPNQTVATTRTVRAQDLKAAPEARDAYARYWKSLPPEKASSLERQLESLERRAEAGENVDAEVQALRESEPQLARLEMQVWRKMVQDSGTARTSDLTVAGGSTVGVECTGIGWIGRNGRIRCIGKLVVQ